MEPEFVSGSEMFSIIIKDCEETIEMIIEEIKELRKSRQKILAMYDAKKVSEFERDIQLERCRRTLEQAKDNSKDTIRQKQLALIELRKLEG